MSSKEILDEDVLIDNEVINYAELAHEFSQKGKLSMGMIVVYVILMFAGIQWIILLALLFFIIYAVYSVIAFYYCICSFQANEPYSDERKNVLIHSVVFILWILFFMYLIM